MPRLYGCCWRTGRIWGQGRGMSSRGAPLIWAAYWGLFDMAKLLLEEGADVNTPDSYGSTPLDAASVENPFIGKEDADAFIENRRGFGRCYGRMGAGRATSWRGDGGWIPAFVGAGCSRKNGGGWEVQGVTEDGRLQGACFRSRTSPRIGPSGFLLSQE